MNCFLSKPKYRNHKQTKQDYEEQMHKYFNSNIKSKTCKYNGKTVKLIFSDEDNDKCYNKFAYGGEKYHIKKNGDHLYPDMRRLERFDWIFEIMEQLEHKCNNCPYLSIIVDNNHSNRLLINCIYNKYKIVIVLVEKQTEYLIISAFLVR